MGVEVAKELKRQFRKNKVKMTVSQTIKSPEKWLQDYNKIDGAPKSREDNMTLYLDMDGVIADFFTGFAQKFGKDHWKLIQDKENNYPITRY